MKRRDLLLAAASRAGVLSGQSVRLERTVPRTGERWSTVGLGTWLTFHIDVGDAAEVAARREVLRSVFAGGGMLIDSSPMYSSAEQVLGETLGGTRGGAPLVAASKVWTPIGALGNSQMTRSLAYWRLARFALMQVHKRLGQPVALGPVSGAARISVMRLTPSTSPYERPGTRCRASRRAESTDPADAVERKAA